MRPIWGLRRAHPQLSKGESAHFHCGPVKILGCCVQVNAAAKSVHAPVMDPEGKVLDPEGDAQLRSSYTANMLRLMDRAGCSRPVQHAVDLGCATGMHP